MRWDQVAVPRHR